MLFTVAMGTGGVQRTSASSARPTLLGVTRIDDQPVEAILPRRSLFRRFAIEFVHRARARRQMRAFFHRTPRTTPTDLNERTNDVENERHGTTLTRDLFGVLHNHLARNTPLAAAAAAVDCSSVITAFEGGRSESKAVNEKG